MSGQLYSLRETLHQKLFYGTIQDGLSLKISSVAFHIMSRGKAVFRQD